MAEPLRHRQTKEAETDMFSLQPPRYIPTLPTSADFGGAQSRQLSELLRTCRKQASDDWCPFIRSPRRRSKIDVGTNWSNAFARHSTSPDAALRWLSRACPSW